MVSGEAVRVAGGGALANAVVAGIGNIEFARPVYRHAIRPVQPRLERRAAVSAVPFPSAPRHRGNVPRGVDPADPVVESIGDVEVARPVRRHGMGTVQPRLERRAAVSAVPSPSAPRHRGNVPRGVDPADAVVESIGNVEVAQPVHAQAVGVGQLGRGRRTAVPAESFRPGPCDRGNVPRGVDLADAMVVPIGDVEVAVRIHRHACGIVQPRLDRRLVVPVEP